MSGKGDKERCVVGEWMDAAAGRWVSRDPVIGMWYAYELVYVKRGRRENRLAGMGKTLAQLAASLRSDDGKRDLAHDDDETKQ